MSVILRNWEMIANSSVPLSGLTVDLFAYSATHPNPGSILSSTTTDSNGMWQFNNLADALYDVRLTNPGTGYTKWYKGNCQMSFVVNPYSLDSLYTAQTARGKALMTSASGVLFDRFSRKSRIIGGSAELWDQGTTPAIAHNTYVGGNWRILQEAANAVILTREATDLPSPGPRWAWKLTVGATNNKKFGLLQMIEGSSIWDIRGDLCALQARFKATTGINGNIKIAVLGWTGAEDATTVDPISAWGASGTNPTLNTGAGWSYLTTPANLSLIVGAWNVNVFLEQTSVNTSQNNIGVMIWYDGQASTTTTDILRVTDVQLERGIVCTSIDRMEKAWHQFLDSRYYNKTFAETQAPVQNVGNGNGALYYVAAAAGVAGPGSYVWRYPVRMRTTPTITYYNPAAANGLWRNFALAADSGAPSAPGTNEAAVSVYNPQVAGDVVGSQLAIHVQASCRI